MMKELTMAALVAGATGLTKADVWDKTFPKSDKVEHCKAMFKNRFGRSSSRTTTPTTRRRAATIRVRSIQPTAGTRQARLAS